MKKILALLFVCAGLTAMAVTPRANVNMPQGLKHVSKELKTQRYGEQKAMPMVLKNNTFSKQMMAPALRGTKTARPLSVQRFFEENKLTPNDNMLKGAPRRMDSELIMTTRLPFFEGYVYDQTGDSLALDLEGLIGGWDFDFEPVEGETDWYQASLYYVAPNYFYVDAANNYFLLQTGIFIEDSWSTTASDVSWVTSGNTRTKSYGDTTMFLALLTEDYVFDRDTLPNFIIGGFMSDGSMYIPDGFVYYVQYETSTTIETQTRANPRQSWGSSTYETIDTIDGGLTTDFFRDTYLLVPTGTHDFVYQSGGNYGWKKTPYQEKVYMFQRDDTTAIVWNLWGFAYPGNYMNIYQSDGSMKFPYQPCQLVDYSEAQESFEGAYPSMYFDWSEAMYMVNLDGEWDAEGDTVTFYSSTSGTTTYWYPNTMQSEYISGTVDDTTIKWNATVVGDVMYYSSDGSEWYWMDLYEYQPCIRNVLTLTNGSKWFEEEAPVALRGDANNDGYVTIDDVTFLIDALLSGDFDVLGEGADCNLDETITIDDVTILIDYLLSGNWPD